jgi:hypothetical protein
LAAAGAAAGLSGCSGSESSGTSAAPTATAPTTTAEIDCPAAEGGDALWQTAMQRGIVYGSSAATWQLADREYRKLFERHPAIVFTEDDLLWWRLRPTPTSDLDFSYGDQIVRFAERNGMLVFGLVWDQGFGEGRTDRDLYGMEEARARELLFRFDAWQARQWQIETRTGSPSTVSRSCSQLHAAYRVLTSADRRRGRFREHGPLGGNASAPQSGYSGFHWLCNQNPAQSPHNTPTRRGARGE